MTEEYPKDASTVRLSPGRTYTDLKDDTVTRDPVVDYDTRRVTGQLEAFLVIPRMEKALSRQQGLHPEPALIRSVVPLEIYEVHGGRAGEMDTARALVRNHFDGDPTIPEQTRLAYDVHERLRRVFARVSRDLRLIAGGEMAQESSRTYTFTGDAGEDSVGHLAYLFFLAQVGLGDRVVRDFRSGQTVISEAYQKVNIPGRRDATRGHYLAAVEKESETLNGSGKGERRVNYALQIISGPEWEGLVRSGRFVPAQP